MHKPYRYYTPEEIRFVKKNIRGRSSVEMTKLFNERFRLRITLKQMETLLYKHDLRNGIGIFRPGHVPANKGKTHPGRQGNYKPVGSERMECGYVMVKVSARKNQLCKNWKRKHVIIWEKAHGKVPRGHVIIFADGNKSNIRLSNLLLVSRKELMVMNHCDLISADKDLTKIGKSIADVTLLIARRTRNMKTGKKPRRKKAS
jgi:hypothetical protein